MKIALIIDKLEVQGEKLDYFLGQAKLNYDKGMSCLFFNLFGRY